MDIGACRHTGVAPLDCVSLAVCLCKSENEPSVFSLIQLVYSYYVSIFILLCVCD